MFVKLRAPAGASSFTFEGQPFEVKKGALELPQEALETAFAHGFVIWARKTKTVEIAEDEDGDS